MAQPEKGLEKWELRKLRELGVQHWKDAADAKAKLKTAMQERAKKNEEKQKGGFASMDAKADDKSAAKTDAKTPVESTTSQKTVEVLPATQTVDVSAPQIVVNVPAPGVTISNDNFAWYPFAKSVFTWVQAAIIGASIANALSSRLSELVVSAVMR